MVSTGRTRLQNGNERRLLDQLKLSKARERGEERPRLEERRSRSALRLDAPVLPREQMAAEVTGLSRRSDDGRQPRASQKEISLRLRRGKSEDCEMQYGLAFFFTLCLKNVMGDQVTKRGPG